MKLFKAFVFFRSLITACDFLNQSHVFFIRFECVGLHGHAHPAACVSAQKRQCHLSIVFVYKIALAEGTSCKHLHGISRASVGFHDSDDFLIFGSFFPQPCQSRLGCPKADRKTGAYVTVEFRAPFEIIAVKYFLCRHDAVSFHFCKNVKLRSENVFFNTIFT